MINTKEIRKLMIEHNIKLKDLSELLGMSYSSVQKKISGAAPMYLEEAEKLQFIFSIHDEDFAYYFFGHQRV